MKDIEYWDALSDKTDLKDSMYWKLTDKIEQAMVSQLEELGKTMPPEIVAGGFLRAAWVAFDNLENPRQWEIVKNDILNFEQHIDLVNHHCDNVIDEDRAARMFDESYHA